MEEALYEIASMRRFAGFSLGSGSIPDETTILNFRHLLETHGITEKIFALVNLGCSRFQRHFVKVFFGTGGVRWYSA